METYGADLNGIEGYLVRFRAVKEPDRRGITLLGLAQKPVKEGYVRAAKAIETLNGHWDVLTSQGYTIDLSPAETIKTFTGLDLPIAIMLLAASILQNLEALENQISEMEHALEKAKGDARRERRRAQLLSQIESLIERRKLVLKYQTRLSRNRGKYLLIGAFDILTGKIEAPIRGMFGAISAAKPGFTVIVPEESEVHAALIAKANPGIKAYKAADLQEVWDIILGTRKPRPAKYVRARVIVKKSAQYVPDFKAIEGVSTAKRAMMVAVAGGHNILLVGPPGEGKSMLTQASLSLLPRLQQYEMYELNKIYSAAGELQGNEVVLDRPFQQVSNVTLRALFGGGSARNARPGLISMAHKGILLFDEINTCPSALIQELRVPLNDKVYSVQRVGVKIKFPCNFIMVGAMNPCKCGWHGHYECPICKNVFVSTISHCEKHPQVEARHKCTCSRRDIERFSQKLTKPLLDRIDLKVLVSPYDQRPLPAFQYATTTIRRRIQAAREFQKKRYTAEQSVTCNADVRDRVHFERFEKLDRRISSYVDEIHRRLNLTHRAKVKLLLVSRTIADLDSCKAIRKKHTNEAVELMGLAHEYFRDFR